MRFAFFDAAFVPVVLAAACVAMAGGCSSQTSRVDRQNPFYIQGRKLVEEQRFEDAAKAFERCLRHAPDSVLAHLQLGMLYEDRLDAPVRALVQYRRYVEKGGTNAPMARQSILRLKKQLVSRWVADDTAIRRYVEELASPEEKDTRSAEVSTSAGQRGEALANALEREQRLRRSIRQLSRLVRHLQTERPRPQGVASAGASRKALSSAPGQRNSEWMKYTVQAGDTLTAIAQRLYGKSSLWPKLREWNRQLLDNADQLVPGMKLRIPAEPGNEKAAEDTAE